MRDRTRFALKQALTIFLLIATLGSRLIPGEIIEKPRAVLMDAAGFLGGPLYRGTRLLSKSPAAAIPWGDSQEQLRQQVEKLTAQLSSTESRLRKLQGELRAVNKFKKLDFSQRLFLASGQLQGFIRGGDSSVFSRSYMVNLGSRQGVSKGCPVVWGRYAVGVVSETGLNFSRVRVLGDPLSRVAVRFGESRHQGVLAGGGKQVCRVRYVSNRIEEGATSDDEVVLTSGADGVFPPGLVVGRVTHFYRQPSKPSADVEVELAVDFSRIESCVILKKREAQGQR